MSSDGTLGEASDKPIEVVVTEIPERTGLTPETLAIAATAAGDRVIEAEKVRRVQLQMILLAIGLVVAFLLLAWRSESNSNGIRANADARIRAEYATCMATAARTTAINPGRVALTALLIKLTNDSDALDAQQKLDAVQTLRDGLILTPIDCGDPPP